MAIAKLFSLHANAKSKKYKQVPINNTAEI